LRLWDIILCSCPSVEASSLTLMGLSMSCSIAESLVGFDRLVKKWWQIFVSPFFVCFYSPTNLMNNNSYEYLFI
jgi:hypothetical protein